MALETALAGWAWPALKSAGRLTAITYNARTVQNETPTTVSIDVQFGSFDMNQVDNVLVLPTDMLMTVRKSDLSVAPTRHDSVTETDGTEWLVMSVQGKSDLHPFWNLQCREI